ncbi:MAG: hypothetical protein ACRC1K_19190 [Planctomycetia bacterium]
MAKKKKSGPPPRYAYMRNPYPYERVSKCPRCRHNTFQRKFPLCIQIEEFGVMILGKTCRYCAQCETIIAHEVELDGELEIALQRFGKTMVGRRYLVMGTVDLRIWKKQLETGETPDDEYLDRVTPFKKSLVYVSQQRVWTYVGEPRNKGDADPPPSSEE